MKKQLIILGIIVLLVCVGLSGCEGSKLFWSDADKLIGMWETEQNLDFDEYSRVYLFDKHGNVLMNTGLYGEWEIIGTFTAKDGKLTIIYNDSDPNFNGTYIYEYSFINSDTLKLLKIPSKNQTPIIYKLGG
jgi:hypothetical protein